MDRNLAYDRDADPDDVIRVSATADVQGTASAIASAFYDKHEVTMRAVGATAVNQAVKAIAVARGFVAVRGVDLVVRVGFTNVEGRDHDKPISAVVFRLNLE